MGEMFKLYKERHKDRVNKNAERVQYATEQFEENGIAYELKNKAIGYFQCWRRSDGRLYQFWVVTGKILGNRNRGIQLSIRELLK